ncbi:unnamed protein product [Mesocestoides corti]|uniref:Uncharacterized protein n=1 Tax=Mesocestoides corti TaxID=53468 RepID=A0A0R3UBW2_MESCO|nr:unnamed protein product [Mesocestoides corti]
MKRDSEVIPDKDLRKRIESQRVDPEDGALYNVYNFEDPPPPFIKSEEGNKPTSKNEPSDEEEAKGPEENFELGEGGNAEEEDLRSWHPEFPRVPSAVMKRLLVRPEDTRREIDRLFYLSKNHVTEALERFLLKFPGTHVIRIDGNWAPTQMFHNLMVKIRALSIRPAVAPFTFVSSSGGAGEEEDEENMSTSDELDKIVAKLAVRKMPTKHSPWQLSRWQNFCPVQLYNGILEYGKTTFACGTNRALNS